MGMTKIQEAVISLINEALPEIEKVDTTRDIISEYGVNSISIIKLIVSCENMFKVKFSDYELDISDYRTFDDLIERVGNKLEEQAGEKRVIGGIEYGR